MEFNDHICWWIGCFVTYASTLFVAFLLFNSMVDFIYKHMKYHVQFIKFLKWEQLQKAQKANNLPAGCAGCKSTFPCEETCGGDPFRGES